MKIIIAFVFSVLFFSSYAQEERNSFLTVNGQGQTFEEATQMALRNALSKPVALTFHRKQKFSMTPK